MLFNIEMSKLKWLRPCFGCLLDLHLEVFSACSTMKEPPGEDPGQPGGNMSLSWPGPARGIGVPCKRNCLGRVMSGFLCLDCRPCDLAMDKVVEDRWMELTSVYKFSKWNCVLPNLTCVVYSVMPGHDAYNSSTVLHWDLKHGDNMD